MFGVERLKGKNVLITGASAGIGEACAEYFGKASCNLILVARRKEKLIELKESLEQKYQIDIQIYQCDVRNNNEVNDVCKEILDSNDRIDVLINNAGLARGLTKIQDGEVNDWEEMIDTNIKGLLYVSRNILPKMVEQVSGHVINIGSIAGREVYPFGNVYCGTKHAVKAISKGMQIDLNGTNIKVTNIDPGMVETEFSIVRFHGNEDQANNVYQGFDPLRAEDIAELALFTACRPAHVQIQDVHIMPTEQATATIVNKK